MNKLAAFAFLLFASSALSAQTAAPSSDPNEGTRQLWNQEFLAARPSAPATAAAAKTDAAKAAPAEPDHAIVGVTVWQFRRAQPGDNRDVQIQTQDGAWTPIRIPSNAPLQSGQKVRVSVESARAGYLYVIDREQYADGSTGEPYLIFPVARTRGGDNRLVAGRLIEIPGAQDDPRYFTVRPARPDQTGELLTVLVTPGPLTEVKIGRDPLKLERAQVDAWEKRFSGKVDRLETREQLGKTYTKAEQDALNGTRLLTLDEPPPQTLYRVQAKTGDALLVKVPLRIGK